MTDKTPKYITVLTLSQEEIDGPVSFTMDWNPPLQEFAGKEDQEPLSHAIMQNIFFKVLLPMTEKGSSEDDPIEVEVSHTLQ